MSTRGFNPNEARDPAGKWTKLANAILKTASNLRDEAGVSHEGHDIYTRGAAGHLEKAAHQAFAGDNDVAAHHLQAALDTLKRGHPHHRELAAIKSHISTHRHLMGYGGNAGVRADFASAWTAAWQRRT